MNNRQHTPTHTTLDDGELVILSRTLADLKAGSIGRVRVIQATPLEICVEFVGDGRLHMRRFENGATYQVADYCIPIPEDDPQLEGLILPYSNEQINASADAVWLMGLFKTYRDGVEAYQTIVAQIGSQFMDDPQFKTLTTDLASASQIANKDYDKFIKACLWIQEYGASEDFWAFYQSLSIVTTHGSPFFEIGTHLEKELAHQPKGAKADYEELKR